MKSKKWLCLIFCLAQLFSCTNQEKSQSQIEVLLSNAVIDTLNIEFKHSIDTDALIDSVFFVFLNTGNEVVGKVSKIRFTENQILLADKPNHIYSFNLKGDLLYHLNEVGGGPKEYQEVSDFGISSSRSELEVLDLWGFKTNIYSLASGEYLRTQKFDFYPTSFYPLEDGFRLFHNGTKPNGDYLGIDSLNSGFFITDGNNEILQVEFPFEESHVNRVRLVTKENFFPGQNGDVTYVPLYDNTIYKYSDGNLRPSYYLNFGDRSLPKDFLANFTGHWREFPRTLHESRYAYSITDFLDSDSHIFFSFISGTSPYLGMYDKGSGRCYALPPGLKIKKFGLSVKPNSIYEQYFVSVLEHERLENILSMFNDQKNSSELAKVPIYSNLLQLKEQNRDSNPILIFYSIKSLTKF